ncbi:Short chain dehydrogenase, partial [Globisporangium splendens]
MDQETVLITGSTRGIGLKFAELYKQRGWKVIGAARDLSQAEQVGSQQFRVHPLIICTWRLLLKALEPFKIVQLDTGDEASILNAAEELEGEAIDFLINNAGIFAGGYLDATTKDDLLKQFEINSVGPFLVTRAFLPHLRLAVKARGSAHVVHVTSRLGSIALCGEPYFGFKTGGYYGYRASKAALNMINASLAVDLKPDSIGTFVLHPGFVMTDLTENHGDITADTSVSGMMRAIDSLALADSGKFFDFKGEAQPCMPYAYGSLVAEQHLSITYNDLSFLQQQQTPSLCTLLLSIVETARGIITTQTTDDDGVGLFEQSNRPPHVLAAAPRSPPSRYEAGLWKLYETLEVAIKSKGVVWINVYASNKKAEREHFFRRLNEEFWTHRAAAVLGGDCNCVLDKKRDRRESGQRRAMGGHRATQALLGPPSSSSAFEMDESTAETKESISRELELMQSEGPIEWSHLEQRIIKAILRVSRAEKRRQLIEEQANAAREAAEFKFGKYMQATQGDARHFFRRIADWQRDQTISRLEPTSGRYHPPNASLADITGAEWHQITGQSHATVPPHKAEQRFDALVYIPETRKVTEAQNQDLMAPITEKEVREAIAALHRHKAGGVDSLNNDFYKDCEDAMVDVLVREFNNIRRGAPMPRSFGQGIVMPLHKKGDSPNPLDYRPITLLTTTYKLFAKVLATRLQDILLWIIGEEQQGFVRDRLMENAILIMQAALDKAYHSSTEGFDDAPGIAMLDFMKAYDTLDRDFLYLVLSKFGFWVQFVDLVRRMHSDTTAQYLVNGELSREWEVKSGIRQGCPLAPLLFIVAAEILALALLPEFGQQSGLHVQPTKSSYICLNTAVVQEQRCGIPILKHGETVRYLGIQIGTGNITQANWEDRLQKLRTRLIIATKVSNSVVGRVLILNSVLLPSILFTASYIKPPAKVVDQLVNLQKQFLWKSTLGTRLGWEYLGEDLVAAEGRNPAWKDNLKRQMESLLPTVDLEWRSDGRVGVYFGRKPEQTIHQLSEETRAFWPSFQWNDNPWIIDSQGGQYTVKTVSFLKECNLASFNVRREEERVFSVRLPIKSATLMSKRMTTLRKIVTSIILCSPEIEIDAGNQLISHQEPWSRKHTKREYKWISNGMGTITAVSVSERNHTDYIQMQRQANGVLWTVTDWTGDATCQQDVAMIEEEIKTRAQAAWTAFLGRWIGRTLTEQALNLFLPHIASRTAPPGQRSLLRELEKHFGFTTPEHSTALQKLWFIVTSSILVLLWRTRVEIVHERQHVAIEESTKCPGGSGWAFIFLNERSNRWGLKACGYAYMGPEATNNWCEYNALKDGLAYSAHCLQHYEVKLEVFGDSQMIIAAQNGFSSIRQTELQPLAVRVNQIIANFAWISWNHTKREQNKMADLLANVAMNSKSAKILTDESRGNDQVLMSQVAALLDNDIEPKEALNQSSMAPKTVLITGSTRGIGLTLAEHYAKLGWHVIGAARDPAAADTIVQLDSTDEASIQSAAQALEGDAIDLLINNAGIFSADGLESATKTELMKQFEVNSVGPFLVTRAFIPHLKAAAAQCGSAFVVQISSYMGSIERNVDGGCYGYRASKAAVNMINSSLAIDLKSDSIGAFVLHPGYVITDLTGHEGDVTTDTSVAGLVGVIDKFTLADSGKFYDFTGKNLPW